jgi:hypothetical protein
VIITNFVVEGSCRKREVIDYGGPKGHLCAIMLENFVYHRLKLLPSTGTTSDVFGFSSEDWNGSDLVTVGKIENSVKHIPTFSVFLYCL